MKKPKTGIEILGSSLFTDRHAIDNALRQLPKEVLAYAQQRRREAPTLDDARLRSLVHEAFVIEPLVIGEVASIRIERHRRDYLNDYRCWMSGHLHEALVPFSGDHLFWRQHAISNFTFSYRGKVGQSAMRLRTFIDGKAFDTFEEGVEQELRAARDMLASTANVQTMVAEKARRLVERVLDSTAK